MVVEITMGVSLAALGAGIAMGVAAIGSGIGVGIAGSAGAGAIAEDPDKFGSALVLQALPQTQGIYGFLGAILIMIGTGILGGVVAVPTEVGIVLLGAGISVGLGGITAIGQGITAASAIGAAAKTPETFGKGMVLSVMSETFAVFGLLVAILLLVGTGLI
jgi:V/A-type H+-transporting ATPase subunit K